MGGLGIFALIVLLTLMATMLGVVVWLAMLPGKVAAQREHPQAEAIRKPRLAASPDGSESSPELSGS